MHNKICLGLAVLVAFVAPAAAQTPTIRLPGSAEPGRPQQPPANAPIPTPEATFTFSGAPPAAAPAAPQPSFSFTTPSGAAPQPSFSFSTPPGGAAPAPAASFMIREIQVEGVTAFPTEAIRALTNPLEGKNGTLADLSKVAQTIEQLYRSEGFVLSRALVPPQAADEGRFKIRVIEGYVGSITVESADADLRRRVEGRLAPLLVQRPISVGALERALLLVNDLPGLNAIGTLRPGQEQGAADLLVAAREDRVQAGASINNRGSKSVGPYMLSLDAAYSGLFGLGEQIGLTLSQTPELRQSSNIGARWSQPLDFLGLAEEGVSFVLNANYGFGEPGGRLRALAVKTASLSVGPRLIWPAVKQRDRSVTVETGFTVNETGVDALGQPLFRDGWRTVDLRGTWVELDALDLGGVTSLSLGWVQGLDGLGAKRMGGATVARAEANPSFGKATWELRHVQPLPENFSLALTLTGQEATTPMVAAEQFTFGGARIGRGLDPADLSGDRGYAASIELRRSFEVTSTDFITGLQPYGFYDYGVVDDISRVRARIRDATTGGLGLRVTFVGGASAGLEWAVPLHRRDATSDTIRSQRVYFDLAIRF